ncbi:transposable element Tcb2 transposase [Trichonephila clavipes]|nr:transposable element Tcb2 transposase [Trichonephila clavipes]
MAERLLHGRFCSLSRLWFKSKFFRSRPSPHNLWETTRGPRRLSYFTFILKLIKKVAILTDKFDDDMQKTSNLEEHHIVRNAGEQPATSSAAIQTQVTPSLGAHVSSRTIRRPIDPRDVIYKKTRLRTPSTDQSSRRRPHRKKYTYTPNCFIDCHPGTGSTLIRSPCVFSNHTKRLADGYLGSRCPLRVLPLTPTHRRLRLEWCSVQGNWTAAEWNQVVCREEFRFNLSSDDNRFGVWRPRGEHINPAFALQRHTAPPAGVIVCCTIGTIHGNSYY